MSLLSGRVCKVLSLYQMIGTYLMMVSAAGVNLLVVGSEGSKVGPAREQVTHAEKNKKTFQVSAKKPKLLK